MLLLILINVLCECNKIALTKIKFDSKWVKLNSYKHLNNILNSIYYFLNSIECDDNSDSDILTTQKQFSLLEKFSDVEIQLPLIDSIDVALFNQP